MAAIATYNLGSTTVDISTSALATPAELTNRSAATANTTGLDDNDVTMNEANGRDEEKDDVESTAAGKNGGKYSIEHSTKKEKVRGAGIGPAPTLESESEGKKGVGDGLVHGSVKTLKDNGSAGFSGIVNGTLIETPSKPLGDGGNGLALTPPPPPLLKGTLSYNIELRRHVLRGMWNFENSTEYSPQRFELIRNLGSEEDPTVLPKDGEFHGSFSLAYKHFSSKGKQKERSKVIPESGVKITFKALDTSVYDVKGEGTNQFGVFQIVGVATKSSHAGDPSYAVVLRKRYITPSAPSDTAASTLQTKQEKIKKRKLNRIGELVADEGSVGVEDSGPLPPPSPSFASNVVCLRGKLVRDANDESGVVHKITGMWSLGLDLIEADPQNLRGLCNRFEYEHRCTVPTDMFPLSGRYTGWFNLTTDDGSRTRIAERDVTLKFQKNSSGFYNVDGKGSNAFGKYNITGTLTNQNIFTIFRHFQPRKGNKKATVATVADASTANLLPDGPATNDVQGNRSDTGSRLSQLEEPMDPIITLNEVNVPSDEHPDESLKPVTAPAHGLYSAVSRGVLRVNEDGSHTCSGKWAATREHFNNGATQNFHFGLEAHHATLSAEAMKSNGVNRSSGGSGKTELLRSQKAPEETIETSVISPVPPTTLGATTFPVDSAQYKGSFKMRRGTTKLSSVVDKQIVLKFRLNSSGSYNVYGKGINSVGIFTLIGTLIDSGKGSGHVELYRMYPVFAAPVPAPILTAPVNSIQPPPGGKTLLMSRPILPTQKQTATVGMLSSHGDSAIKTEPPSSLFLDSVAPALIRRESSRQTKVPPWLEKDDPQARLARMMEKCNAVLSFLREKDAQAGSFFAEPVDPVAHGIPTYHQIITNPMDLGTVQAKLDAGEVSSPEEFARLVKLVFENAMKFNVDVTHVVHTTARNLLITFNQKFRDIERETENMNKERKPTKAEIKEARRKQKEEEREKKRKEKEDRLKRKRPNFESEGDSKKLKMNEIQAAAVASALTLADITAAAPTCPTDGNVTRAEFSLMLQMMQQMQQQLVSMQSLLSSATRSELPTLVVTPSMLFPGDQGPKARTIASAKPVESIPETKKLVKKKHLAKAIKKPTVVEPAPPVVSDEELPLTLAEQEELTKAINAISPDKLPTVIQIIRESASLNGDEEEIDLEIDQLDTTTQRKLQRFVMKSTKPKRQKKGGEKEKVSTSLPTAVPATRAPKAEFGGKELRQKPSSLPIERRLSNTTDSFLAFGSKGDDTDSESDSDSSSQAHTGGKALRKETLTDSKKGMGFSVGNSSKDGFGINSTQDDDDEVEAGAMAANWSLSKPIAPAKDKHSDEDDDAWAAARNARAASKQLGEERQAREERIRAEAEAAKEKHLAEAAAKGDKIRAERKEKEAKAARLQEQKERDAEAARQKAREEARNQIAGVQQTVDLDAQRDIMRKYEQSFYDKDLGGGASPSSDFGF